ncbi:MAG TPA: sigma-70 family RNA polymerase sigma factor [Polyangia bacterium]|nr:sigma-70 family RNA polymerase sigma factor [Polyangia bacterium]
MLTVSSPDRLVTDHLPYTKAVTQDLLSHTNLRDVIQSDDAVAYGHLGLLEAASRFRPGNGASFATFSYSRIRGAVMDGIRRSWGDQRSLRAHDQKSTERECDQRLLRRRPCTRTSFDPTELLDNLSLRAAILPALRALSEMQRQVILLYYFEDFTLERIAQRLRRTRSHVARVHHQALAELARRLKKLGVEYGFIEEAAQ